MKDAKNSVTDEKLWSEFFSSCESPIDAGQRQSLSKSISENVIEKVFIPPPSASYLSLLSDMGVPVEKVIEKLSHGRQQAYYNDVLTNSAVTISSLRKSLEKNMLSPGPVRLKFHEDNLVQFFNIMFTNIFREPHLLIKLISPYILRDSDEFIYEKNKENIMITVGSNLCRSQTFLTIACKTYIDFISEDSSTIIPFPSALSPVANSTVLRFLRYIRISANSSCIPLVMNQRQDIINSYLSNISASNLMNITTATATADTVDNTSFGYLLTICNENDLKRFVELIYDVIRGISRTHNIGMSQEDELIHDNNDDSNNNNNYNYKYDNNNDNSNDNYDHYNDNSNDNYNNNSNSSNNNNNDNNDNNKKAPSQIKLSDFLSKMICERFRLQINTCSHWIPFIINHVSHALASPSLPSSASTSTSISVSSSASTDDKSMSDTHCKSACSEIYFDNFLCKCLNILLFAYNCHNMHISVEERDRKDGNPVDGEALNETNSLVETKLNELEITIPALLNQIKVHIYSNDSASLLHLWQEIKVKKTSNLVLNPSENLPTLSTTDNCKLSDTTTRLKHLILTILVSVIHKRYHIQYFHHNINVGGSERKKNNLDLEPKSSPTTIFFDETVRISLQQESVSYVDGFFLLCCEVIKGGEYDEIVIVLSSAISLFYRANKFAIELSSNNIDKRNRNNCGDGSSSSVGDVDGNGNGKRDRDRNIDGMVNSVQSFDEIEAEEDLHVFDRCPSTRRKYSYVPDGLGTVTTDDSRALGTEDIESIIQKDSESRTVSVDNLSKSITGSPSHLSFYSFENSEERNTIHQCTSQTDYQELNVDTQSGGRKGMKSKVIFTRLLLDYLKKNALKIDSPIGIFLSLISTNSSSHSSATGEMKTLLDFAYNRISRILYHPDVNP